MCEIHKYNARMITDTDIKEMANVIYHEARGESRQGQIAVGQVVVNRIASGKYPNTVKEVVWQRHQFSGIRYHAGYTKFVELAREILSGKHENIVGNSLNFNAIRRKGCKIRIGHHCFF